MMRNLIALELAKHRKNFRNMGLLIALSSAVIAIAFSISGDMSLSGSITYTLNFAFIGSAFLLPLYFGVATANCLRREPDKSTEDCLPASPLRRVWAAYRAGLVYSAALGLVVTIVFLSWQIPQGSNHFDILEAGTFLLAVIYFHLVSFLFGYMIRNALLASGAAIVTILLHYSCISALQRMSYSWMIDHGTYGNWWNWASAIYLGALVLAAVIAVLSLIFLARKMQRGIKAPFEVAAVVCLLLLLPLAFIFFMFFRVKY